MKLFKKILAFVLALLLIIPAVQFNFGSGVKKAYALMGSLTTVYNKAIPLNNPFNVDPVEILYGSDGTIYYLKDGSRDFYVIKDNGSVYSHTEGWMGPYVFIGAIDNDVVWTLCESTDPSSSDKYDIYLGKVSYGSYNFQIRTINSPVGDIVHWFFFDFNHNAYIVVYYKTDGKYYIRQIDLNSGNIIKSWPLPSGFSSVIKNKKTNEIYLIDSASIENIYTFNGDTITKIATLPFSGFSNVQVDPDGNLYAVSQMGAGSDNNPVYKYNFSNNSWTNIYTTNGRPDFVNFNIPGIMLYSSGTGIYMTNFVNTIQLSSSYSTAIANSLGNILIFTSSNVQKYNFVYNFSINNSNNYSFNTNFDLSGECDATLQRSKDGVNFSDVVNVSNNITTDNYALGNVNYYYRLKYFTSDGVNMYVHYSNIFNIGASQNLTPIISSFGGLTWSRDTNNRGTGYVTLSWSSIKNATGYKVWVFDGNQYRAFDVGNTTSWDSRNNVNGKIWPTSSTNPTWSSIVNSSNNSISTDVFNHSGGGGDLPDDPNILYQRTVGTSYDSNHYYTFAITAYNSNNESNMSSTVNVTLPNMTDTNAPVISSFTIDDGVAKTGSPQLKLSISATDTGGSGLSKIEISTDNFATIQQTVSASGNSFSTTINNFQVPATPGTINVYVRAWDVAGNVSSVQKAQIALMNDVTPPTAQLKINNGAEFTTTPNVSLYITAYDDWTPIDQLLMRLSNDGKTWTSWMPLSLTYNWTLDSSSQGYKSVFLQVQDASANVGTTSAGILYSTDPNVILGIQADTTAPTISYLSLAKGATITSSFTPTIKLVASDNVTPQNQLHVYASADGVNWFDLGLLTSNNITLPNGLVTAGFNSIDFKVEDSSYNKVVRTLEFFKL